MEPTVIDISPELQNWVTLASMPNQGEFFDHMNRLSSQLRYDEPWDEIEAGGEED